jgi:hypothetical protein
LLELSTFLHTTQEDLIHTIKSSQSTKEGRAEGRELCFQFLSVNPGSNRVKVVLARLFYLDGYYDFSLILLQELRKKAPSPLLDTLTALLGGSVDLEDKVLAEAKIVTNKEQ